jgi:hypothetical protein
MGESHFGRNLWPAVPSVQPAQNLDVPMHDLIESANPF